MSFFFEKHNSRFFENIFKNDFQKNQKNSDVFNEKR